MRLQKSSQRPTLEKIEEEYEPNLLEDTEDQYLLKEAIESLSDLDKAILITYADLQSMSKTAKLFCVSPATIYTHIVRIRNIIKEKIK